MKDVDIRHSSLDWVTSIGLIVTFSDCPTLRCLKVIKEMRRDANPFGLASTVANTTCKVPQCFYLPYLFLSVLYCASSPNTYTTIYCCVQIRKGGITEENTRAHEHRHIERFHNSKQQWVFRKLYSAQLTMITRSHSRCNSETDVWS